VLTRPGKTAKKMAEAIIDTAHSMYQNKTALKFFRILISELSKELQGREEEDKK